MYSCEFIKTGIFRTIVKLSCVKLLKLKYIWNKLKCIKIDCVKEENCINLVHELLEIGYSSK